MKTKILNFITDVCVLTIGYGFIMNIIPHENFKQFLFITLGGTIIYIWGIHVGKRYY